MIRLSIIIPFYNVEKYIAECLDSVYNQDIPEEEYEVICVNDGSPDHSRDIVLKYMEQHSNLKLIEHECNKKLGAARNTGRRAARGKYIWNVDSDDMIAPNCLKKLVGICEKYNLDILFFNFYVNDNGSLLDGQFYNEKEPIMDGVSFIREIAMPEVSRFCPVWKQLYKKSFLDQNEILSPEINMGEDVPYSFKSMYLAKLIKIIPDRCYIYRYNSSSLTGKVEKLAPSVLYEKCIVNSELIYEICKLVAKKDKDIYNAYKDVAKYTLSLYKQYLQFFQKDETKDFWRLCKKSNVKHLMNKSEYIKYKFHIWLRR